MIGHHVSMLMPVPYRDEHDGYLARYRQTGKPHIIGIGREVRGQRRDGTTFPIALAMSAVYLGDRRLFTGIVHDLSARAQAEEALRASEAFYRNTLDTMLEGCQIIGFDWRYRYLYDCARAPRRDSACLTRSLSRGSCWHMPSLDTRIAHTTRITRLITRPPHVCPGQRQAHGPRGTLGAVSPPYTTARRACPVIERGDHHARAAYTRPHRF